MLWPYDRKGPESVKGLSGDSRLTVGAQFIAPECRGNIYCTGEAFARGL